MLFRTRKRKVISLALVALVVVVSTALAAAWFLAGSGQAKGKGGTPTNLSIVAADPSTTLYPGGSAPVAFKVNNPNTFPAHVDSISLDSISASSGCNTSEISLASGTYPVSINIPAGSLSGTNEVANALSATLNLDDGCKGADILVDASIVSARAGN